MDVWKPAAAPDARIRRRRILRILALVLLGASAAVLAVTLLDTPEEIRETGETRITVNASSEKNAAAAAAKALDQDPETAWIPKSAQGGRYEALRFTFSRPTTVSGIRIVNGFAANHKQHGPLYDKYNRAKAVRILLSDNRTYYWMLADREPEAQTFHFAAPHPIRSLQLFVHSVHKGILYDELAVSEVSFF